MCRASGRACVVLHPAPAFWTAPASPVERRRRVVEATCGLGSRLFCSLHLLGCRSNATLWIRVGRGQRRPICQGGVPNCAGFWLAWSTVGRSFRTKYCHIQMQTFNSPVLPRPPCPSCLSCPRPALASTTARPSRMQTPRFASVDAIWHTL
jgi:hypothetical protein